ncbi:MAG: ATPase, T2SS/T4P/T4SS family, partial [Actinomycetota bacterium]
LPKHVHASVVSRIKIVSGMDIAERRRPQDGSGRIRVDNRRIDMRVSTILTLTGEKVVIRLLRQEESLVDLATLGMEPEELAILQQHLTMPQGLIVFTGPTGSGKTTTLYGSLMYLKSSEKNIVTIEDPIEYQMPGVSQVQIDEKTGMGFARWLRSVLRQDPNVIMVGEIRDLETAEIVMQSALTGHLVLSTLHTNDAPSAVIRLVDLGVEAFLVASAVTLVVAQRLVRVICDQCREAIEPAERVMSLLGLSAADLADVQFSRGKGCERCGYTGYRGRTGIYEIMPITAGIRAQISAGSSDTMLDASAHAAGMRRLRESGLRKVRAGVTTLEEVLRVTRVEREAVPRCPRCRQEIDPSFVVCPHCQVDLGGHACPKCGKEVQAGWAVCPFCRAVLPAAEQPSGRPRVLVVDDEPNLLSLVTVMLEEDFEVMTALTGEEGIRRATLERPDIVLLDLRLPDVSGVEVARRLQQSAVTSVIPVIMITGAADATSEIESLRAGVDDYVEKPFDEEVLRARMAKLLQKAARSRQDGAAG